MHLPAFSDTIKEKAGGNCVLEERAESGCCVESKRGAPDEDGAAEFPEQSRKGREACGGYQRVDPPNHEVNMIDIGLYCCFGGHTIPRLHLHIH